MSYLVMFRKTNCQSPQKCIKNRPPYHTCLRHENNWFVFCCSTIITLVALTKQNVWLQIYLNQSLMHTLYILVTEKEIQMGIIENETAAKSCLWFRRIIQDIEKQPPSYLLSRYKGKVSYFLLPPISFYIIKLI